MTHQQFSVTVLHMVAIAASSVLGYFLLAYALHAELAWLGDPGLAQLGAAIRSLAPLSLVIGGASTLTYALLIAWRARRAR